MTDFVVVCYDVRHPRRLRRVANELENFGVRVQRSVFECHLNDARLKELKKRLSEWIDAGEDQVRYYKLCPKDMSGILLDGTVPVSTDAEYHLF